MRIVRLTNARHAVPIGFIGSGFVALALVRGGWWLAGLWPGISFLAVALAYACGGPHWLGKGANGRFAPWTWPVFGPFVLFTWITWHLARVAAREPAAHEVAPGVWVGRRAGAHELPPDTRMVVDLTCEMWTPRGIGGEQLTFICIPTLDGTAPDDESLARVLARIAEIPGGTVYVHCAQGRGRSAAFVARLLIARGVVTDVDDAVAMLNRVRPSVRLNAAQRAWVSEVCNRQPGVT